MNLAVLFVFLYLFFYALKWSVKGKNRKRVEGIAFFIITALLIFFAAVRSWTVGSDTPDYIQDYNDISFTNISTILSSNSNSMGYYIFSWLFKQTGSPVFIWFGVIDAIYLAGVLTFIKKFSQDKLFSYFCFFALGLYFPSFNILKQVLAMGLVLFSFCAFADKKKLLAVLFFLMAFSCHQSVVSFIPAYILYYFKNKIKLSNAFAVATCIMMLFGGSVWALLVGGYGNEHYSDYIDADNAFTMSAFYYLVFLLCGALLIRKPYHSIKPDYCGFYIRMFVIACAIQSLASNFSIAHRLAYYYFFFIAIYFPNAVTANKFRSERILERFIVLLVMSVLIIYTQRSFPYEMLIQY